MGLFGIAGVVLDLFADLLRQVGELITGATTA
jgi:hypothetical protein